MIYSCWFSYQKKKKIIAKGQKRNINITAATYLVTNKLNLLTTLRNYFIAPSLLCYQLTLLCFTLKFNLINYHFCTNSTYKSAEFLLKFTQNRCTTALKIIKMTKILTLKAGAAVAMAEFNVNPTPPLATYKLEAPPPATTNCNPQKCPWWPYSSSKDFKANTALIVIVLICALIIALAFNAAIRYIIRLHCSRRRDEEAGEGKAETGAAEAEVAAKIPWLIYSEEMEVGAEWVDSYGGMGQWNLWSWSTATTGISEGCSL